MSEEYMFALEVNESETPPERPNWLTRFALVILAGVVVSYLTGALILGVYSASIGIPFEYVPAYQNIMTGLLWYGLFALAYLYVGILISEYQRCGGIRSGEFLISTVSGGFIYLIIMMAVSVYGAPAIDQNPAFGSAHLLYTCGIFLGLAILPHTLIWACGQVDIKPILADASRRYWGLFILAFVFLVFLFGLHRYATDVYPIYPAAIGGGG